MGIPIAPLDSARAMPLRRHARPCAGHPRLAALPQTKDVDGRDKPGHDKSKDVDGRDIGGRKHAVLWTAMPGHDEWESPLRLLILLVQCLSAVMPGLVPGIHVLPPCHKLKTWMAGTSPAMTRAKSWMAG